MNFSTSLLVHQGLSVVHTNTTISQRWGDYTGMARQYSTGNCYFAGSYGSGSAYITEIAEIGFKLSGINENTPSASQITVFPNPVTDIYNLEFVIEHKSHVNISVFDVQGRQVSMLFDGTVLAGNQKFSFNKAALTPGIYTLVIKPEGSEPVTRKIVVASR